jgi:hypothetical protein
MRDSCVRFACLGLLSVLAFAGGCASPVPGQSGRLASRRITVTIQCAGPMYNNYYYYFLINRFTGGPNGTAGDINANGPVPVLDTAYFSLGGVGNGFATGSVGNNNQTKGVTDYGLTDFVVYNIQQPNSIALYHVNGNPNVPGANAVYNGSPYSFTLPSSDPTDTTGQSTLTFTIDLTQLVTDTNDATAKVQEALAIHYIQINIVATNLVPTSQANIAGKEVDSIGNTLSSSEQNSFITIDLTQNKSYYSTQQSGTISPEQPGDVYPQGAQGVNSIDLVYWSITVAPAQ